MVCGRNITMAKLDVMRFAIAGFGIFSKKLGLDTSKTAEASDYFLFNCADKPHLLPYAKSALDYLHGKYALHIITNGFEDVQPRKLRASGITDYFETMVTSETSGAKKPAPEIFEYALRGANAKLEESIMIGDNPSTDIKGAAAFGMKTVFL